MKKSADGLLNIGNADPFYRCPFTLPASRLAQQRAQAEWLRQRAIDEAQDSDLSTREEKQEVKKPAKARQPKAPKAFRPEADITPTSY